MSDGRRRFAVAVTLVLVAGACSSGGHGSAIQASTTTAPTTPAAVTTTTVDPTKAAILAAYRAEWADVIAVSSRYPINPIDPRLALHATGKQLLSAQKALTAVNLKGHYEMGSVELNPVLTLVSGDSATIMDCYFDHSVEVDYRTGKPVDIADVGHTLLKFTMVKMNGHWFVTDSTTLKSGKITDACTPAGS